MILSKALRNVFISFALLLGVASVYAQSRYTYSATGDEVNDSQTGLVWRRCSEGQSWDGVTCTGNATPYKHEAALVWAQAQSGAAGWRLPNVKELSSITDRTRSEPAIDIRVFPETPSLAAFWTATPYATSRQLAWGVSFSTGDANYGGVNRGSSLYIRLVR